MHHMIQAARHAGNDFNSPVIPFLVGETKGQSSELYYMMENMCDNDDINHISRHESAAGEYIYIYIQDCRGLYIKKTSELCFQ